MTATIPAPAHLTPEAQRIWTEICATYSIDAAAAMILQSGLESRDMLEIARTLIERDGLVLTDSLGRKKPNPAVGIARDSANTLGKCFRLLGLDLSRVEKSS